MLSSVYKYRVTQGKIFTTNRLLSFVYVVNFDETLCSRSKRSEMINRRLILPETY